MLLKSHQSVMTFIKGWLNNLKILVCAPRSLTHAACLDGAAGTRVSAKHAEKLMHR
jgi:hypothetical protein